MLCISTSGALGRFISLPPPVTIWYRALFALFIIGAFCWYRGYNFRFDPRSKGLALFISGCFMAGHWVTYFYALQWANVAIAMLTLFTYPILTTLLEPLFFKSPLEKRHLGLGAIILVGIFLLAPDFNYDNSHFKGLLMGLLSAFFYAIRNLILKKEVNHFNGSVLMFYQMLVLILVLLPVHFIFSTTWIEVIPFSPYILFLSLITTAVGHTLFLNSFKHFSISTASIMSSMQPIFGILIAILFLAEYPDLKSIIGGLLILSTVILESLFFAGKKSTD